MWRKKGLGLGGLGGLATRAGYWGLTDTTGGRKKKGYEPEEGVKIEKRAGVRCKAGAVADTGTEVSVQVISGAGCCSALVILAPGQRSPGPVAWLRCRPSLTQPLALSLYHSSVYCS